MIYDSRSADLTILNYLIIKQLYNSQKRGIIFVEIQYRVMGLGQSPIKFKEHVNIDWTLHLNFS